MREGGGEVRVGRNARYLAVGIIALHMDCIGGTRYSGNARVERPQTSRGETPRCIIINKLLHKTPPHSFGINSQ